MAAIPDNANLDWKPIPADQIKQGPPVDWYQPVITADGGKHWMPLGGRIYANFQHRFATTDLTDAYEGKDFGAGYTATDGKYNTAAFPYSGGGTPGSRWTLTSGGNPIHMANAWSHFNKVNGSGQSATSWDNVTNVNTGSTDLNYVLLATYNDTMNEVVDPTIIQTQAAGAVPTLSNTGVLLHFSTPITAGFWHLSGSFPGAPLAMPTGSDGWFQQVFCNTDPTAGLTSANYASWVAPGWWSTQGMNPSMNGRYILKDGSFAGASYGSTFFSDFAPPLYGVPTSGTVTRGSNPAVGTPLDATMLANMRATAGSAFTVTQALQSLLSRNNAEVTVSCNFFAGGSTTAAGAADTGAIASTSLNQLRPVLVAKANATPLATSTFSVSLKNQVSGSFDAVYTAPAKNAGGPNGFGDWITTAGPSYDKTNYTNGTAGQPQFPAPYDALGKPSDYLYTDANAKRAVDVRVGVKQLLPSLLGWKLTINLLYVEAGNFGPYPRVPSMGFSN